MFINLIILTRKKKMQEKKINKQIKKKNDTYGNNKNKRNNI
jgi:hypothetical protein